MTVIVSSKTQGSKKIGNASRSALVNFKGQNHFWMSISKWSEKLPFSIFSTIHLNMFLNIFHATLGIKLILSKHRTEETNDELMMPLVKRINTYLSMYESKYKITIKITMSSHMSPYHKLYDYCESTEQMSCMVVVLLLPLLLFYAAFATHSKICLIWNVFGKPTNEILY